MSDTAIDQPDQRSHTDRSDSGTQSDISDASRPIHVDKIDIRAVETRFLELDKAVAMLEMRVFIDDLGEHFGDSIGRLHDLRNEVALSLAEAETLPDIKLDDSMGSDLMRAIEELNEQIERTTEAINSAGSNAEQNSGHADRLWM
jgi:hypothetical protein